MPAIYPDNHATTPPERRAVAARQSDLIGAIGLRPGRFTTGGQLDQAAAALLASWQSFTGADSR